jgi:AraC-like DNA-binding protein
MFSRFFYVINGQIIFNRDKDQILCASPGMIVYLPNNITYTSEWTTKEYGEYISINFILDEYYVRLPDHICVATEDKNGVYLNMFRQIYATWHQGPQGYHLDILSQLYKIMYSLFLDSTRLQIRTEHSIIYKGILHIENHYLEKIRVSELAQLCSVSETTFRRLFRKYKNMAPVTYRNYLRIRRAAELLQTGEYSIQEAASEVKIPDVCYFHKLFKHFLGCTPSQFLG